VEVRWRSVFPSTSLGKRCISYNAPPTSRKHATDRWSLRNFLPRSSLFMFGKAQKSHRVRSGLHGGCSDGVPPIHFFQPAPHKVPTRSNKVSPRKLQTALLSNFRMQVHYDILFFKYTSEAPHRMSLYSLMLSQDVLHKSTVGRICTLCPFVIWTMSLRQKVEENCIMRGFITCPLPNILLGWSNQGR
jgi:hypothetical protein